MDEENRNQSDDDHSLRDAAKWVALAFLPLLITGVVVAAIRIGPDLEAHAFGHVMFLIMVCPASFVLLAFLAFVLAIPDIAKLFQEWDKKYFGGADEDSASDEATRVLANRYKPISPD